MLERIVESPANARISLVVCMVVIFILLAVVVALVATRSCIDNDSILQKFTWTVPPPPSIKDEVCVYVSSGLFNLYEVMYSIGLKSLANTSVAGSVFSDHVPTLYQSAQDYTKGGGKFGWFSPEAQANLVVNSLTQGLYQIPDGGIAETLKKPNPKVYKKSKGWRSYIPARDGFNMAFFISATTDPKVTLSLLQKSLPKLTADMWAARGTTLLEAVYGFDMYNLVSRCNVCIFNANGIAMDDGSCVELGICTTRGYPCVIHRNELTSNFPAGVINPMVAGAAGYSLGGASVTHPTIGASVLMMDAILKSITTQSGQQLDYGHFVPPPKLVSYWCNVGEVVWQWKYTSDPAHYKINSDGTLDPSSYSDEFVKFMHTIGASNPNLGKSLVVAKICLLIHDVKLKYGIIQETQNEVSMTASILSTMAANSQIPPSTASASTLDLKKPSFIDTLAKRGTQGFAGPR